MSNPNFVSSLIAKILRVFLSVDEKDFTSLKTIKKVLIVRQHNQFGDLLASVSLFRAIKESFPECRLTVIVSPENYYAITKNKFIDEYFIFDKKRIFKFGYLAKLIDILRNEYDLTIVPVTVAISKTSCLISRLAKSNFRVGPKSLDGKSNQFDFLFNKSIEMNWLKNPDRHVSDFGQDIFRPLGISTTDLKSEITYDAEDEQAAEEFIESIKLDKEEKLIGLHVGAGKLSNRWSVVNFCNVMTLINENYKAKFYITGSSSGDSEELNFFSECAKVDCSFFVDRKIP